MAGGAGPAAGAPLEWPPALCERAEALISTICPSLDTNKRRQGVQEYVKSLIARAFHPEQAGGARGGGGWRGRGPLAPRAAAGRGGAPGAARARGRGGDGARAPRRRAGWRTRLRRRAPCAPPAPHRAECGRRTAARHAPPRRLTRPRRAPARGCQVDAFMFGSVPLKTYLPDGDIDLSVFCGPAAAAALRDTWALRLQDVLLAEQGRPGAPFAVGDVTVINAEVREEGLPRDATEGVRGAARQRQRPRARSAQAPLALRALGRPQRRCQRAVHAHPARPAAGQAAQVPRRRHRGGRVVQPAGRAVHAVVPGGGGHGHRRGPHLQAGDHPGAPRAGGGGAAGGSRWWQKAAGSGGSSMQQSLTGSRRSSMRWCHSSQQPQQRAAARPASDAPAPPSSHQPPPLASAPPPCRQVKAWCYYEARLLGAHHGLISTYALETLVLYVFNKHHALRPITSPLQVRRAVASPAGARTGPRRAPMRAGATPMLKRRCMLPDASAQRRAVRPLTVPPPPRPRQLLHAFLVEFGSFDWDRCCLTLHGPIALQSFPHSPQGARGRAGGPAASCAPPPVPPLRPQAHPKLRPPW
jgi:hypothetical protein